MYNALNLFYTHVKYTVSLMFTLLTVVFAAFGIALSDKLPNTNLLVFLQVGRRDNPFVAVPARNLLHTDH